MKSTWKDYTYGLLHLFFPDVCIYCSQTLLKGEKLVCYCCLAQLEKSRYHSFTENEVMYKFEGKVRVKYATAGYRYHKSGILQHLIFKAKYHNHKKIVYLLGEHMAYDLSNTVFSEIDYIIPVPLHPKKERKRGYNQSEWIALGISLVIGKPVLTGYLIRKLNTKSQTNKNSIERYENTRGVFALNDKDKLLGKHILLVDDIVTTGSTLESCCTTILGDLDDNVTISIACLAVAD